MNQNLALEVLATVMAWDDAKAREEYGWLSLMSRLKYDDYRDFRAGIRFIESLADWLQQFEIAEREVAYRFVRKSLVYIGPAEMQHLVELVYPEVVQPCLLRAVAIQLEVQPFLVWSRPEARGLYDQLLRKCLFLGLSDGARIDEFRRASVGIIGNEQVVAAFQLDQEKWTDLLKELRADLSDQCAQFEFLFVIDDFTASGSSLLRQHGSEGANSWKGKLPKLWRSLSALDIDPPFVPNFTVCVHHYLVSDYACAEVARREAALRAESQAGTWFANVEFSFGANLPADLPMEATRDQEFLELIAKYYDASLENQHTLVGGTSDVRLGFGGCGLPLVLEHNTPNNSIALLWAETNGKQGAEMRPLFRRRQRHS